MAATQDLRLPEPGVDAVHEWLTPSNRRKHHPAEIVIELRDRVDDLRDTRATFKLTPLLDDSEITHHEVIDHYLYLLGSWKSPHSEKATRWVNPSYPHRARHSDVLTRCECGALMARQREVYHETPHDSDNDHADDCTRPARLRARADLCEKRATAIRQCLSHGVFGDDIAARVGLKSIGSADDDLGVETEEMKEFYFQARANTLVHLLTQFSAPDAGRVYGISNSTVRAVVAKQTGYDVSDLTAIRRAGE
jgi:hypothetical protein